MKKNILFFLVIASISGYAQTLEQLVGKWQFQEIVGEEEMDEKKSNMMQHLFGNMKLEFKKDGTYETTVMGKEEKGTWKMEGMLVKQTSESGKASEMVIKNLTDKELSYEFNTRSKDVMKMVKVNQFNVPDKKKPAEVINVEAKPKQIYGTWYFKEKEMSVDNEAAIAEAFLIGMFEKAYFKYNKDGTYEDDAAFNQVVVGTWKLEEDNTVLVITKKDKPVTYDIVGISKNELRLVSRKLDGAMTFVRDKPEREE